MYAQIEVAIRASERAKCVAELRAEADKAEENSEALGIADSDCSRLLNRAWYLRECADLLESPKGPKP